MYRAELRHDHVAAIILTRLEPHAPAVAQFLQLLTQTAPHDDGAGTLYWTGLSWS
jgi:hypothetical protein